MSIFFTSDTHFGSERTLKLSKRPFKTVEEMDNTIISNWNKTVSPVDSVFHLGDFGDINAIEQLNGYIHLICGNYEFDMKKGKFLNGMLDNMDKFGNFTICGRDIQLKLNGKNEQIYLVHEPRYYNPNEFNLFGHIHKLCMVKKFGLNVGVDCHNFTPIGVEEIAFYKNAIENHYDENVFI